MCAETDQDRRHRLEVVRQNVFVRINERRQKYDHQNTFARIPFQRMVTEEIGSKLFPLFTIIFTLDVPVIIK